MEATSMNIYQRIQQVQKAVAYVKKDKAVENYMAVTHDAVTALVRLHFIEAGIVIVPRIVSSVMLDTGRKSAKGNAAWRYEGRFEVDFVNIDEPTDRVTVCLDAHADDYGDKAPGKALSYSVKGAMLKLLMLETGVDDEGRLPEVKAERPNTGKQVTADAFDAMDDEEKDFLRSHAKRLVELGPEEKGAYYIKQNFDAEEKLAIWSLLPAETRRAIKIHAPGQS
jgi:hypothetical protein